MSDLMNKLLDQEFIKTMIVSYIAGFIASISIFRLFTYSFLAETHALCASSSVLNLPKFFGLPNSNEQMHMYFPLDLSKHEPRLLLLCELLMPVISVLSHFGTNMHVSGEYCLLNGISRSLSNCHPSTALSTHHSRNFMKLFHSSHTVASAYPGYLLFFFSLKPLNIMSYHTEYAGQNSLTPSSTGDTTYGASLIPNPLISRLLDRLDFVAGNLAAISFDNLTQSIVNLGNVLNYMKTTKEGK